MGNNKEITPGAVAASGAVEKTSEGVAESAGVLNAPADAEAGKKAAPAKKVKTPEDKATEYMQRLGVSPIYANSKGEFFTDLNYAILSEGGKKSNVKIYLK